eukprot:c13268_g1_i1.p1 GENE.c13268_g1_i1~~c13268_g1_i1.p1  ORF type:complete len:307 (-),score=76.11 c13268_g1_i1:28-948(-)
MNQDTFDDDALVPSFMDYFDRGHWKQETRSKTIDNMTDLEVADFVRTLAVHEKDAQKTLLIKIAGVIEAQNIDGGLLIAGGSSYLKDSMEPVLSKREHPMLPKQIANVFREIAALGVKKADDYWDRISHSNSPANISFYHEFQNSAVGSMVQLALQPQPLEALRYTALDWLPRMDVQFADKQVEKFSHNPRELFKIVSVSLDTDPDIVRTNMIYGKDQSRKWALLASIDFARHGSALPGHWHVNRTPDGSMVEHWSIRGEVWHGEEEMCPLWWMMVPETKTHFMCPDRLVLKMKALQQTQSKKTIK